MHCHFRWADLLLARWPRIVINGLVLQSGMSRRIVWRTIKFGRFNDVRQWMMMLLATNVAGLGIIATIWLARAIRTTLGNVIDSSTWWIDVPLTIVAIALAAVVPATAMVAFVIHFIIRPELPAAVRQVAETHCLNCQYDLRGHASASRCPECGASRMT